MCIDFLFQEGNGRNTCAWVLGMILVSDTLCITGFILTLWLGTGVARKSSFYNSGAWKETSSLENPNAESFLTHFNLMKDMRANHYQSWKNRSWREVVRWLPRSFLGCFWHLSPTAHVLPNTFHFPLSFTKMDLRDSTVCHKPCRKHRKQKACLPCHSHSLKHGTHQWKEWHGTLGTNVFACRWQWHFWQVRFISAYGRAASRVGGAIKPWQADGRNSPGGLSSGPKAAAGAGCPPGSAWQRGRTGDWHRSLFQTLHSEVWQDDQDFIFLPFKRKKREG